MAKRKVIWTVKANKERKDILERYEINLKAQLYDNKKAVKLITAFYMDFYKLNL